MIKVLVIDDSALARKLFGKAFADEPDFEVFFARDGGEGLEMLNRIEPDVVTLDINMPGLDGLATLDRIMIERPCPVLMVSTMTRDGAEATLEALRLGAVDFVAKPTGTMSLRMRDFAPLLVAKVRFAASAKVKASRRLRERVQHRLGTAARRPSAHAGGEKALGPANGNGLVLIGASTGGPPALELVLRGLSASFPWPNLIAQHMPGTFTGPLARRLDSVCDLVIREVAEAMPLAPGHAYIGAGDFDLIVSRRAGALFATPIAIDPGYPWHPSADRLVESALALVSPGQLIGVLLTGMGSDGASAMNRMHRLGGRTIAESEETAVVWGMPGELANADGADWILPLPRIAEKLKQLTPAHAAHP
jgi:two-component system chemotaxis response regulator CheB